jgi:hypothetical protein
LPSGEHALPVGKKARSQYLAAIDDAGLRINDSVTRRIRNDEIPKSQRISKHQ